jgi:hypothetical protein
MRYFYCLVGVQGRFFVLVDLREQGTDLHMRLALVFQHLQFEGWLCRVIEELLHGFRLEVL